MTTRISSRDDLFLSALDLYTLLSLVFIGVSFMTVAGAEDRSTMDLPALVANAARKSASAESVRPLEVTWKGPEDAKPSAAKAVCLLHIAHRGTLTIDGNAAVPCQPLAFAQFKGTTAPALEAKRHLAEVAAKWTAIHAGQPPAVVIRCDRTDLMACARLQWIFAEAGFRPTAAVQIRAVR